MSQFRGFISIDVGACPKLIGFEKEVKKTGADLKLVEPENVHITLKFLGETEETLVDEIEKIMNNAVKETKSFNIQLKGVGVFPSQSYVKVVWVGIEHGDPIAVISQEIDEKLSKLGFKTEERKFSPHLTIARVKTSRNKDKLLQIIEKYRDVEFTDMKVDSIKLKKSDLTPKGPIYTTLKEVKI